MDQRFDRHDLFDLALSLLTGGGMETAKAEVVAELLVRTDEIGVRTHGISMVPYYLPELKSGNMASTGSYTVVSDSPAAMVWDGNYLPGQWVMSHALEACMQRASEAGVACLAIRRSHHIGCLSTLTRIAAENGFVCLIATSDPAGRWVAPFGGVEPILTPNPWAVGYPGGDHPVLIDTCASITTVSKVREHINSGTRFEHPWMLDGEGRPTTDPNVVNAEPRGTILPAGGIDHGHKGFGLALLVEMLTQALSGHGRAEEPSRWGANVFLQALNPDSFCGAEPFRREVAFLNDRCRASRPAQGFTRVRIPGDRASEALKRTKDEGVPVSQEAWGRISDCAAELGVPLPRPMS